MREDELSIAALVDEAAYDLDELARSCVVSRQWVLDRVAEGLLAGIASGAGERRFSARDRLRAARMFSLERDFEAVPELAALAADLMEEIDRLRARLRRAGLDY